MGETPADAEVRQVVAGALDTLRGMGAGVDNIDIPGLDTLLRDTSTIAHEFTFDLQDFLTKHRAPVRSLDEILRSGLYRTELDDILRRRNETRDRADRCLRDDDASGGRW